MVVVVLVVVVISCAWERGGPSGTSPAQPQAGRGGTTGSGDAWSSGTSLCRAAIIMEDMKRAVGDGDAQVKARHEALGEWRGEEEIGGLGILCGR